MNENSFFTDIFEARFSGLATDEAKYRLGTTNETTYAADCPLANIGV